MNMRVVQGKAQSMEEFVTSPFDVIRQVDDQGKEFWNARDLAKPLDIVSLTNFTGVINTAELAYQQSGEVASDHFLHIAGDDWQWQRSEADLLDGSLFSLCVISADRERLPGRHAWTEILCRSDQKAGTGR